jgi:hypothetical protein
LARAWKQAARIDVTARSRKVTVKRIAIATRWGMAVSGPADAHLSVKDPEDEGEPIKPEEKDALFIGLLRLHIANLIRPLGHAELSDVLKRMTHQPFANRLRADLQTARSLLDAAPVGEVEKTGSIGGLVGGIVTRAGPVNDADISGTDQEVLARLNLRPIFVGIDRDLIRAAIDAEPEAVRGRLTETTQPDDFARSDRAGGWIVPLGQERRIIGGV